MAWEEQGFEQVMCQTPITEVRKRIALAFYRYYCFVKCGHFQLAWICGSSEVQSDISIASI